MLLSSARGRGLFYLGIISISCVSAQIALAGDSSLLKRISPHIALNQNPLSQELQSGPLETNHFASGSVISGGDITSPPPKKRLVAQDLYFLALGAHFRISDWLDIGAACTMPFTEEENVRTEDLSIKAMVTMQF
jgi:hypothetical protein